MAASTSTAYELTAEQVLRTLTQPLEQESVFLGSGVRIIDTASQLRIPAAPASKAAELTFTGENELIPEVDHDFTEITLMPSTMESIKTLTRFSNELARQSIVSLDSVLKQRMVADVAAKIDAHFLSVGGDGITTPQGLFGFTGVQTVAAGGALTLDTIMEGLGKLVAKHVPATGLKLFVRAADYLEIRGVKDSTGRYILAPENSSGLATPLLGITPVLTDRVPAGSAALVSPSHIVVARDASPSIKVLDQTFGQYDQQAIRVTARYDAKPTNPDAIVVFTGIV